MSPDLVWALGAIFALTCATGTAFYNIWQLSGASARERANLKDELNKQIDEVETRLNKRVDDFHNRINEMRDQYVRREDLNGHMTNIENVLKSMQTEQRATNSRIDQFITLMAAQPKHTTQR